MTLKSLRGKNKKCHMETSAVLKDIKINLDGGTTYLPKKVTEGEKVVNYIEGTLHKNTSGRLVIDEAHGFCDGNEIQLLLCGTWVKSRIVFMRRQGYVVVGLTGLKLDGLTARMGVK